MRTGRWALFVLLCAARAGGCEALTPKNPVKVSAACGYAEDSVGGRIADLDLKLVTSDQTTVSEVHTDAKGNFRFATLQLGTYVMTSGTPGWTLDGWPIRIMSSESDTKCKRPLIVRPSLAGCGGSASKKGYRPKF